MNYGLYLSASGVLNQMHRQDVIANNLANANTVGFKRMLASFRQRDPEVIEDRLDPGLSQKLLDRLGGGTLVQPSRADRQSGPMSQTHNNLDLAIQGEGYFVVGVDNGGEQVKRLTRDGRFTLSPDGRIVTTDAGHPLLDAGGKPIQVDPAQPLHIDEAGKLRQDDRILAQLDLVQPDPDTAMIPAGKGLWQVEPDVIDNAPTASGQVMQGWLEQSNVDPVREMLAMIETTRAISSNGNLIRYHDMVMDRAVNVLGRVA